MTAFFSHILDNSLLYQMRKVHFFFPLNLKNRLLKPCKNETPVKGDELAREFYLYRISLCHLFQVNGKSYPQAKLLLGQMGALHPANRLAAYITGRLRPSVLDLSTLSTVISKVASNAKVAASRKPRTLLPSTSNSKTAPSGTTTNHPGKNLKAFVPAKRPIGKLYYTHVLERPMTWCWAVDTVMEVVKIREIKNLTLFLLLMFILLEFFFYFLVTLLMIYSTR